MTNTYEILSSKREEFNAFVETSVVPLIGEESAHNERESFAETAKRISDDSIQKQYCDLAIEMLRANINNERPQATLISVPEKDSTFVVASTLFISAWAYSREADLVATLAIAGFWYMLAEHTHHTNRRNEFQWAVEHNESVSTWIESIQNWEESINELEKVIMDRRFRELESLL